MSEKVTIKVEHRELHLPTIALRGLVVFPNNLVHFEVGREKSIAAVEWAMANNSNVFLVAQKAMETSDPTQADLFSYGVVAEVKQVLRVSEDLVKVLVEGFGRSEGSLSGRLDNNLTVEFAADASLMGSYANVHLTGARATVLLGELA